MDFSSLVLMEKDKETGFIKKELGSYQVGEGAECITKMYYDGKVNIYFDTKKDVDDWEYSAIFDTFEEVRFQEEGYEIEQVDDEFNPTWLVKFDYVDEYKEMSDKLNKLCILIRSSLDKVFEDIKGKEEDYK